MARKNIKDTTLRALFAKSGNVCAFPGCSHELVTDRNLFVGQVCHIEAASPDGPRYNQDSEDEERRDYKNLILLCYKHHKEIDSDVEEYTVHYLKEVKANHESDFSKDIFEIDQSVIYQIEKDMRAYWGEIDRIRNNEHVVPHLAVEIDTSASPFELFNKARSSLSRLHGFTDDLHKSDCELLEDAEKLITKLGYDINAYKQVKYYENPFEMRNWEIHNLGITNSFTDLSVILLQLEIKFLEAHVKLNTSDETAKLRLSELKVEMEGVAKSAGYVD